MGFKLADLFVQFSVQGLDAVTKALDTVEKNLKGIEAQTQKVADAARSGFGAAAAALTGFVTAGVAMSTTGQVMQFQLERLSRIVAGLFGPEIRKVTDLLARFTSWLEQLSNAQKANLAVWLEAAAAALAFVVIVPRVVAGIGAVIAAVNGLTAAITAGEIVSGLAAILPVIGAIAAAATVFFAQTETGRGIVSGLWNTLKGLWEMISNALAPALQTLGSVFAQLGEWISRAVDVASEWANALLEQGAAALDAVIALISVLMDLLSPFVDGFLALARVLVSVVVPAIKLVTFILQGLAAALKTVDAWLRSILGLPARKDFTVKTTEDRGTLAPRVGGPESLADTYTRIAQATRLGSGQTDAEKAQSSLDKLVENTGQTNKILDAAQPIMARGR